MNKSEPVDLAKGENEAGSQNLRYQNSKESFNKEESDESGKKLGKKRSGKKQQFDRKITMVEELKDLQMNLKELSKPDENIKIVSTVFEEKRKKGRDRLDSTVKFK